MDCRCLVGKHDWQQHKLKGTHELGKGSITRMDQQNVQQEKAKDLEVALRDKKRWRRKRRTWDNGR